jgi:hypothetical protein
MVLSSFRYFFFLAALTIAYQVTMFLTASITGLVNGAIGRD